MKRIIRVILSILRRPIKSLLLLLVIFVMCNVIAGSLILFNTTQSIKNEVMNQITPSVIFETPIDDVMNRNPKLEIIQDKDYYAYKMKLMKAFDEIKSLPEVKYADYGATGSWNTNKKYNYSFDVSYKRYYDLFDYKYLYNDINVFSVSEANHYYLYKDMIKITDGRNFTEEEINNGTPVIILPKDTMEMYVYDQFIRSKENSIKVGDNIELVFRIFSDYPLSDIELKGNYESIAKVYTEEDVNKINEEFDKLVLDEKVVEVEVIGFYEWDKDALELLSVNYFGLTELAILPYNFYNNEFEAYVEKIDSYLNEGKIKTTNEYGEIIVNNTSSYIRYNYFELKDSDSIESFVNKSKEILKKYDLNCLVNVNNELYLKLAGPLEAVNSVSKFILIVAIIVAFIVLSCISFIFLKDRKKEIGILLSLGEEKKYVITQVMLEILLVSLLGIGGALFTAKEFSMVVNESIFDSYETVELSTSESLLLEEGLSQKEIIDKYETALSSTNSWSVVGIVLLIVLISTGSSTIIIIKMKPKDILM